MAKGKFEQARVLVACTIHGIALQCNQLVESDPGTIKAMVNEGQADDHASAVKYCVQVLKQKPVQIVGPEDKADAIAEAEAALKAAQDKVTAAKTADEKAQAHKAVDEAKAALEALN